MEDEPYSDQLIRALQQLRARVEEVRGQHNGEVPRDSTTELMRMHGEARPFREAWFKSRRLPPPSYGASPAELLENNRQAMHVTAQEAEFLAADIAIDVDFSVEAIDNAIRVVESQA
jgi:hypothetical protein